MLDKRSCGMEEDDKNQDDVLMVVERRIGYKERLHQEQEITQNNWKAEPFH